MADLEEIQKKLEKKLKKERYIHTLGVMYTAGALAMCYGEDIHPAMTAGLLHDCGKFASNKEQMELCKQYRIPLTESEIQVPALIHAKLGAYLADHIYGIKDCQILDAILYHTTGKPEMNLLEKIIFLADYIEPGRKMIPGLPEVRKLAFQDIDSAVCLCTELTLQYLEQSNRQIDPMTRRTYEYYKRREADEACKRNGEDRLSGIE